VAEVHHFTYGAFNPIAAYLVAFLGSLLGLLSTGRARAARTRGRRSRWLLIGALAIGGAIWLTHFAAMLGFDVPVSPVRYDLPMTAVSLGCAVVAVGIGLMIVGHGPRRVPKTLAAGLFTGGGVFAMHYTGMAAVRVSGEIHHRPNLVAASAVIAVGAATAALWFAVSVRGWGPLSGAAAVMAAAVCGMHYTGMAALWIHLEPISPGGITGFSPLAMVLPITVLTAAAIVALALLGLQAMTEEEFTDGAGTPRRGVHAEQFQPWSLKQASINATRRTTTGPRPTPRPVPLRSHSGS